MRKRTVRKHKRRTILISGLVFSAQINGQIVICFVPKGKMSAATRNKIYQREWDQQSEENNICSPRERMEFLKDNESAIDNIYYHSVAKDTRKISMAMMLSLWREHFRKGVFAAIEKVD